MNILDTLGIKPVSYARARNLIAVGVVAHIASVWLIGFEKVALHDAPTFIYGTGIPTIFCIVVAGYSAVLVTPIVEEFCFRTILYRLVFRQTWWGDILQAAIFSAAHGDCGRNVTLFALGLFLSYTFRRWGLVGAMVVHAGYNLGAIVSVYIWYVL